MDSPGLPMNNTEQKIVDTETGVYELPAERMEKLSSMDHK